MNSCLSLIIGVWLSDEGLYVCEAKNPFGTIKTGARLSVTGLGMFLSTSFIRNLWAYTPNYFLSLSGVQKLIYGLIQSEILISNFQVQFVSSSLCEALCTTLDIKYMHNHGQSRPVLFVKTNTFASGIKTLSSIGLCSSLHFVVYV